VCSCAQFNDDWTPEHLTRRPTNLYSDVALTLKGAEWRKPGLVAVAATLASSVGELQPIDFEVPDTYEPETGPNPWTAGHGARVGKPKKRAQISLEMDTVTLGEASQEEHAFLTLGEYSVPRKQRTSFTDKDFESKSGHVAGGRRRSHLSDDGSASALNAGFPEEQAAACKISRRKQSREAPPSVRKSRGTASSTWRRRISRWSSRNISSLDLSSQQPVPELPPAQPLPDAGLPPAQPLPSAERSSGSRSLDALDRSRLHPLEDLSSYRSRQTTACPPGVLNA
jgi:hypothetical protein